MFVGGLGMPVTMLAMLMSGLGVLFRLLVLAKIVKMGGLVMVVSCGVVMRGSLMMMFTCRMFRLCHLVFPPPERNSDRWLRPQCENILLTEM
jgi:hypothetical protein